MKIDFSKALPITIVIIAAVIITLSLSWYGLDLWGAIVIGIFVSRLTAVGIDKYVTYRKAKK